MQSINIITEGGKNYYFCDECYNEVKDLTTNCLESYCRRSSDYLKTKIKKSKEKRENGNGKWVVDNK